MKRWNWDPRRMLPLKSLEIRRPPTSSQKKYRVKTAWDADIWSMRGLPAGRGQYLAMMVC
jgi:hypothetical protein